MSDVDARPSGGGHSAALSKLIEELTRLPDLDPVSRAQACPGLIDAAKAVLSVEREDAMLTATTGAKRISQVALAKSLGVSRSAVTAPIARARARKTSDTPS